MQMKLQYRWVALAALFMGGPVMASEDASSKPTHTNRLSEETSPYLLQHAHNPVDWYPWGEEAFAAARAQNKPIFLSVGYSTCYWCHVMERESFENEAIAELMNEHFICVKVDREERPDVDDIYMTAVQVMTGRGGWPMSVFLLPDTLEPVYGGTYFPPVDNPQQGRPGFPSLLTAMNQYWNDQEPALREQGAKLAQAIREQMTTTNEPQAIGQEQVDAALSQMLANYDRTNGGFSTGAPKFPMPVNLEFLQEAGWSSMPVRDAMILTLDRMAMGGMYDQVGGGFHRYSVDDKWLVPHFEKMLYDNAMLASVYALAAEETGDSFYAAIASEILDYVLREMTSTSGAFYSAQDAESNAKEGDSYLWTPQQIRTALTDAGLEDDVEFTLEVYGLNDGANFRDPHHPGDPPRNVLRIAQRPEEIATRLELTGRETHDRFIRVNEALLAVRDLRDQPGTDDKILSGWNGLMIGGMADGGRLLGDSRYTDAARRAAAEVMSTMWSKSGGLMRTKRGGAARIPAFLEDYAFMIRGLLRLEAATGDPIYLDQAAQLAAQARERFWDPVDGGWYDTLDDQSDLFVRGRSFYDGAVPSANGVMINAMITLHERTGRAEHLDDASKALAVVSSDIVRTPRSAIHSVQGLHRMLRDHPGTLSGGGSEASSVKTKKSSSNQKVAMGISQRQVRLAQGESATVVVTLVVDSGWHVNSPVQTDEFIVPLSILSLSNGVQVQANFPPGEPFTGPDGPVNVYSHSVEIPVTVTRTGDLGRSGQISITWQACNSQICLAPVTTPLPLKVLAPTGG